jgi:flotillin
MSVEEIYSGREKFASTVQEVAGTQLAEMGLELTSFTINDISDNDGYIEALGKEQIAKVKAQAAIAEAEAAKERDIQIAEAKRIGETAKLAADTQIAEANKNKQLKLFEYQREQQTKKAEADAAYHIQENIVAKQITDTEMDAEVLRQQRAKEVAEAQVQIQIVTEGKNIELAKKKAERKEAELQETVLKPAEADLEKQKMIAEVRKFEEIKKAEADAERKKLDALAEAERKKLDAIAEAEKVRQEGEAHAAIIEARGKAEADALRRKGRAEAEALEKKAEALAKMEEAGRLQMVLEKMPELAKAIAEPLSRIGTITIIGGSNGDSEGGVTDVARMSVSSLKTVMDCMKDVVGFDLAEVMRAQTFEGKTTKNIHVDVKGLDKASAEEAGQIVSDIISNEAISL